MCGVESLGCRVQGLDRVLSVRGFGVYVSGPVTLTAGKTPPPVAAKTHCRAPDTRANTSTSAAGGVRVSGTEAGSYLRRIDSCITQLKAQGPSRTCDESKEVVVGVVFRGVRDSGFRVQGLGFEFGIRHQPTQLCRRLSPAEFATRF